MAQNADRPDLDVAEGAVGIPSEAPVESSGGFDFWLFGLLVGVAALIAVQNLWLRRKAKRDNAARGES